LTKFSIILAALVAVLAACSQGVDEMESPIAYQATAATSEPEPLLEPTPAPEPTAQPEPESERIVLSTPGAGFDFDDPSAPVFREASVHDPSVFRVGDYFYVIGSHMSSAKTSDFIQWTQISAYARPNNPLIDLDDFREAFEWARTDTFWAGDVQQMPCGRFFMYYCNCEGSMPLGNIGLAIAYHPEGPYVNQGIFLRSGMQGASEDGMPFDANRHPNAVDPHAFFDSQGEFWMVYGSYSGGIFILRMNPETGFPLEGQGYGKRLTGGNHSRIEGPYILFSPKTEYYYLFLSFGGLDRNGGYNIRVARSRYVDGPYYDAAGNSMLNARGAHGSFFDDAAIEPFGTKLIGSYWFRREEGETGRATGYLSPGHNSAYFDEETGRYYIIFHTRFTEGYAHQIRVHEMFLNDDGWFVISPFRFDGAEQRTFTAEHVPGSWKLINHGREINRTAIMSETVNFTADGIIYGAKDGSWSLEDDGVTLNLIVNGISYNGRLLRSFNRDRDAWVMSFTALSQDGIALWGSGVALESD